MVLVCIFLITNGIYFFICLPAICVSSVYSGFKPIFALICIVLLDFRSSLYILVINSLAFSILKILSPIQWLNPFTFLYISHTHKNVKINRSTLFLINSENPNNPQVSVCNLLNHCSLSEQNLNNPKIPFRSRLFSSTHDYTWKSIWYFQFFPFQKQKQFHTPKKMYFTLLSHLA